MQFAPSRLVVWFLAGLGAAIEPEDHGEGGEDQAGGEGAGHFGFPVMARSSLALKRWKAAILCAS